MASPVSSSTIEYVSEQPEVAHVVGEVNRYTEYIQKLEDIKSKSPNQGLESIIDELLYNLKMKYFEVAYGYNTTEQVEDSDINTELMDQLMEIMTHIIIEYIRYIKDKKEQLVEGEEQRAEKIGSRRERRKRESDDDGSDDDNSFHTILRFLYQKQIKLKVDSPGLDLTALSAVPKIFSNFSGLFSKNKETLRKLIRDANDNEFIMLKIKEMMKELDVVTAETGSSAPTERDVTDAGVVTDATKGEAKKLLVEIATKIEAKVDLT